MYFVKNGRMGGNGGGGVFGWWTKVDERILCEIIIITCFLCFMMFGGNKIKCKMNEIENVLS